MATSVLDERLDASPSDVCLTGRFEEGVLESSDTRAESEPYTAQARRQAPGAIESVLLVEDSMIIALDTEEALHHAGVKTVKVAASSDSALAEIARALPDFALLDFNLGHETSERVAEALKEAGVPFSFATGYGEALNDMGVTPTFGVLRKPYSRDDIVALLERVVAKSAG